MREMLSPPTSSPDLASPTVGSLRLGAYVLLADLAFLEQSIRSYYDHVADIVAIYDERAVSWNGRPLPIERCLAVVERLDTHRKVRYVPGNFHHARRAPLELETTERNAGIAAFGSRVDWVLQIDTDEVLGDPARFVASIEHAQAAGCDALEYPARWLYGHVGGDRYLERCRRTWGISAGFPGPVAVRAGTALRLARQCDVRTWRVDFRARNTDPAHPRGTPVDERIRSDEGIWHFSWVRSEAEMRAKAVISGHSDEFDWGAEIDRWVARCRHPRMTTLLTPVRRAPSIVGGPTWLRTTRVPLRVTAVTR